MRMPQMSEQVTHGIRVGATAFFLPNESDAGEKRFVFEYQVVIVNESDRTATLLNRHWTIIDGNGQVEEVRGPGVVGQQPRLEAAKAFKYHSFCPLRTEWGTMEGEYEFEWEDGEKFMVKVGRFFLAKTKLA